jgi:HK97 gp10 family phage protein
MTTTKGRNFVMSWTPDASLKGTEAGMIRGLELAAIAVEGEWKRVVSKPGPMKSKPTPGQQKRLEQANEERRASKPGEPPRKRTGELRASIGHAPREGGRIQRVGSSAAKARHLEWGTSRMKPRPSLRPTFRRMLNELHGIIVGAMKHGKR